MNYESRVLKIVPLQHDSFRFRENKIVLHYQVTLINTWNVLVETETNYNDDTTISSTLHRDRKNALMKKLKNVRAFSAHIDHTFNFHF